MRPPYKFIEVTKSRHGSDVVYFRKGRGPRQRLPPLGDRNFREAYFAALEGKPLPHVRDLPDMEGIRKQSTERYLRDFMPRARARSLKAGRDFDVTLDWLLELAERQAFRCAVTGIPFFTEAKAGSAKRPFWPSVDRIDCSLGYTKGNVRLVVFALNVMLMDWGTEVFERVANAYRYTKTRTSIPAPTMNNSRTSNLDQ